MNLKEKVLNKKKLVLFLTTCLSFPGPFCSPEATANDQTAKETMEENLSLSYERIFIRSPHLSLKDQIIDCLKDFESLVAKESIQKKEAQEKEMELPQSSRFVRTFQRKVGNFLRWSGEQVRAEEATQNTLYRFFAPRITILCYDHPAAVDEFRRGGAALLRTLGEFLVGGKSLSLVRVLADMRWSIGKNVEEDQFWNAVKQALSEKWRESGLLDRYKLEDVTEDYITRMVENAKEKIKKRSSIIRG